MRALLATLCLLLPSAARAADDPAALLARTREVMGFARAGQSVIHYKAVAASEQSYQSDRTYPPFFSAMEVKEAWLDPTSGVERTTSQTTYPGGGGPPQTVLSDGNRAFGQAKDNLVPLPVSSLRARYLDPWAAVADWSAATGVRLVGRERYRDYVRVVLARATPEGEQRLFLDPKSGFPLKLDFVESHYLWGQRRVEYLWSNWTRAAGITYAGSSFRLADGLTETSQTVGELELVARATAPAMALPAEPARSSDTLPRFLQPLDLTTVQVGPSTYLLSNAGYTEAVTLVGDELFVFDATQGEERVRKDVEAIEKLFPGKHKVTLVVTDLAWPHFAGLRAWVARGATVVAHKAGSAFLHSIVDRRWTLAPDALERQRKTAKLKLVGVDGAYELAGGAVTLHPIDGIGSEVALLGYVAAEKFLWASDFIQTAAEPSAYAAEVAAAVRRDGLAPERTAAEHLPLTPWKQIEELQKR